MAVDSERVPLSSGRIEEDRLIPCWQCRVIDTVDAVADDCPDHSCKRARCCRGASKFSNSVFFVVENVDVPVCGLAECLNLIEASGKGNSAVSIMERLPVQR